MKTIARALLCFACLAAPLAGEQQTWGTTDVAYVRIPGIAFFPDDSGDGYGSSNGNRWGTGIGIFSAPLNLPSGARVVSMRYDFVDSNPNVSTQVTLAECDPHGDNCDGHPVLGAGPADCLSPGYLCSGIAFADGNGSQTVNLSTESIVADPVAQTLSLRILCISNTNAVRFGSVLVGYRLQVSPAPLIATFGDVPTSHPFFQFIEALADSGITAGCGSGNFCPDSPLTRGQMAVFLAKALGLHFP